MNVNAREPSSRVPPSHPHTSNKAAAWHFLAFESYDDGVVTGHKLQPDPSQMAIFRLVL